MKRVVAYLEHRDNVLRKIDVKSLLKRLHSEIICGKLKAGSNGARALNYIPQHSTFSILGMLGTMLPGVLAFENTGFLF